MSVVLLNHAIVRDSIASVHREGCRDIERDSGAHGSQIYGPFPSVDSALADYLDAEMVEMGYGRQDVKVHACARGL